MKILMKKFLNLKLVIVPEYRHTNISFLRDIPKIGDVFIIRKIKNTVPWTYVISDLNGELITRTFYKKELQKTSPEKFRIEKVLKGKGDKLYVKWKGYDN